MESPEDSEGEADGVRGRFSFLARSSRDGEGWWDRRSSRHGRPSSSPWERCCGCSRGGDGDRHGRRRLLLEGIGRATGCCWRLLTASVSTVICRTMAAICASVVTAGCGELGSAAEGGGEASSRREEHLTDPVILDRWALVFVISISCLGRLGAV